jgi:hypothetical protein
MNTIRNQNLTTTISFGHLAIATDGLSTHTHTHTNEQSVRLEEHELQHYHPIICSALGLSLTFARSSPYFIHRQPACEQYIWNEVSNNEILKTILTAEDK